jgi:hypothetical protein
VNNIIVAATALRPSEYDVEDFMISYQLLRL